MVNNNKSWYYNCIGRCKSIKCLCEKGNKVCYNCLSKCCSNKNNLTRSFYSLFLICTIIDKNSINNSLSSNVYISKFPLSDISDNSQYFFDKYNITNRSVISLSNDLFLGNRLSTSSNRVRNIEDE